MVATEALPDEEEMGHEAYREAQLEERARRWRDLDRPAREAWSVWMPVADQVDALIPDSKESPMRLDLSAVRWSMDVHGIPASRQLAVWKLVKLLHDIRWHRNRTLAAYCQAHAWVEEAGAEPWDLNCKRCRATMGVTDAASD